MKVANVCIEAGGALKGTRKTRDAKNDKTLTTHTNTKMQQMRTANTQEIRSDEQRSKWTSVNKLPPIIQAF
jgi:hypothetical protein